MTELLDRTEQFSSLELTPGEHDLKDAAENIAALIETSPDPDEAMADLITDTRRAFDEGIATENDTVIADIAGAEELGTATQPDDGDATAMALSAEPTSTLGVALHIIETVDPNAVEDIISKIDAVQTGFHETHGAERLGSEVLNEQADHLAEGYGLAGDVEMAEAKGAVVVSGKDQPVSKESSGIPQFDRLEDYSPEFAEQILMHRSNAELNEGDIVFPSDQISEELHAELNTRRGFTSSSSPRGSGGYDRKLAHAGTRDFGKQYGQYLYEVEPLEADTLKWGENFGASTNRKQKATSPAISDSGRATTDSLTGKQHNEVVSTQGFRVIKRIEHEPHYAEAMLPWPVSSDAVEKHKARYENTKSEIVDGFGQIIRTTSRKRPGKIGRVDSPGTYRAGADHRNPAEWRAKFDARKQQEEHPGQYAMPGMSINALSKPDRWKEAATSFEPNVPHDTDIPLPGMDAYRPPPQM